MKKKEAKTVDRENHPTTQKMLALDAALEKKKSTASTSNDGSSNSDAATPTTVATSNLLQGPNKLANKKGQKVTKLTFDNVSEMCVEHVGKEVDQQNLVSRKIR